MLMKKFGTPNGAAPGSANEKVGLAGVGTPGPVGPVVAGLGAAFLCLPELPFFTALGVIVLPVVSLPRVLLGLAKVEDLVLGCWDVAEEEDEEEGEVGREVVLVVVGVVDCGVEVVFELVVVTVGVGVEVVAAGWQLAVTLWTGGVPGGSIEAGGVPGGAFTVKVSTWPSSSVAVTVH